MPPLYLELEVDMKEDGAPPCRETRFRYVVVSKIRSRCLQGMSQAEAIAEVADQPHWEEDGSSRKVSIRTLYRWIEKFDKARVLGNNPFLELTRKPREETGSSRVLSKAFLEYLVSEKKSDEKASVPELIKRAREKGHIKPKEKVCRSTVNRALKRLGVSLARRKSAAVRDSRRYSFAHRMECVLCDGKHFRAGVNRAKRVALFYLDDATRYALHVVVGTSESQELFLRGLYELVRRFGLMSVLYLDHGAGFRANDTKVVAGNLGAAHVHGEKAYPEGHGKIEAFNKTAKAYVLRGYDGSPELSPTPEALELRLGHYIKEVYNHTPHGSLGGQTPHQRFSGDPKSLRFPDDDQALRDCFCISLNRVVANDNVISWDATAYEMPFGYARQSITLIHKLLEGTIHFLHQGRYMQLHPVDPIANARLRRARTHPPTEQPQSPPSKSAADMAFERTYKPLVGSDGGYSDT